MDGVVWRKFEYKRAFLYFLADREPLKAIEPNEGLITSMNSYRDLLLDKKKWAILNDTTNFLRLGDITVFSNDGIIEFIEIKSGKKRRLNQRIRKQKRRMEDVVDFFNNKSKKTASESIKIYESKIKQKNFLPILLDSIKIANHKGYHSSLIGNYMILEVIDLSKMKGGNYKEKVIEYMNNRHRSIKEKWKSQHDFIIPQISLGKLDFIRNYAPYSIFPFSAEVCADIIIGKIVIKTLLNFDEILRKFSYAGWKIVWSLKNIKESDDIDIKNQFFLKIWKSGVNIEIYPGDFGRIQFEFISPEILLQECELNLQKGPQFDFNVFKPNYPDEKNIWE